MRKKEQDREAGRSGDRETERQRRATGRTKGAKGQLTEGKSGSYQKKNSLSTMKLTSPVDWELFEVPLIVLDWKAMFVWVNFVIGNYRDWRS